MKTREALHRLTDAELTAMHDKYKAKHTARLAVGDTRGVRKWELALRMVQEEALWRLRIKKLDKRKAA